MDTAECRRLFSSARVARLATTGSEYPHLVPVVFAVHDDHIFSAVDHKKKRSAQLQRLANIAQKPAVCVLADHYEEDWGRLWWVRADGEAHVLREQQAMEKGLGLLQARYQQYRDRPPAGPVIEIIVTRWTGWSA